MPEHQPRDITEDRESGKPFGHGCSMSHALPLWGARHHQQQLARAVGEVSWGAEQSKRNRGGFLSLGKCSEGQRPSSCFSPPSLLLTGRLRTFCALSWYLMEETQSRRNTGLLKSVVNPTSVEMKARPQKLLL